MYTRLLSLPRCVLAVINEQCGSSSDSASLLHRRITSSALYQHYIQLLKEKLLCSKSFFISIKNNCLLLISNQDLHNKKALECGAFARNMSIEHSHSLDRNSETLSKPTLCEHSLNIQPFDMPDPFLFSSLFAYTHMVQFKIPRLSFENTNKTTKNMRTRNEINKNEKKTAKIFA